MVELSGYRNNLTENDLKRTATIGAHDTHGSHPQPYLSTSELEVNFKKIYNLQFILQ